MPRSTSERVEDTGTPSAAKARTSWDGESGLTGLPPNAAVI